MITKEEREKRIKRWNKLKELMAKYNIKTGQLARVTSIRENNISSMKTGNQDITQDAFDELINGIAKLISIERIGTDKPNVEIADFDYVKLQLTEKDNVFINKKKVKDIDDYLVDLKLNGFDCTYSLDNDGNYIVGLKKNNKPMIEKVIQPAKPKVEEDLSIISKVRSMHEDSLALHEEALKLQAETDEIVKSVDEMEERVKGSVTNAFGLSVEPVEQITITDEDIAEAQESKDAIYQPTEEEKEELKELAEETLANCGLEKGIHSVDLVEFLETRFNKLEVRGFLRGKAIESLLEEDYQTAAMCIKYFTDNGYIEMGEGV